MTTALSMVVGSLAPTLAINLQGMYHGEIHRLALSSLFFTSTPQILVGLMLIYTLRQVERLMGSRKFGSFIFLSFFLSLLIQLAIVVAGNTMMITFLPSPGPFYYIFSTMPFFHQFIPKLRPSSYTIMNSLNFVISEKSLYYLFALQLVFSDGMNSAIPSLAGILAYYTYSIDGLGLNEYRIPGFIEGIFKTCGGFVCSLIPMVEPNFNARVRGDANVNRMLARATAGFGGPGHGPGHGRGRGNVNENNVDGGVGAGWQALPPPSEEQIQSLVGLGFDRPAVLRALEVCNNNVEVAANRLLGGQ